MHQKHTEMAYADSDTELYHEDDKTAIMCG